MKESRTVGFPLLYPRYIYSQTAVRRGIQNLPNDRQKINLKRLHNIVVLPLIDLFGLKNIYFSSCFRTKKLNRVLGGRRDSFHLKGLAFDFEVAGCANTYIFERIKKKISLFNYDRLILENFIPGSPYSGWVHISIAESLQRNRGESFYWNRKKGLKKKWIVTNYEKFGG